MLSSFPPQNGIHNSWARPSGLPWSQSQQSHNPWQSSSAAGTNLSPFFRGPEATLTFASSTHQAYTAPIQGPPHGCHPSYPTNAPYAYPGTTGQPFPTHSTFPDQSNRGYPYSSPPPPGTPWSQLSHYQPRYPLPTGAYFDPYEFGQSYYGLPYPGEEPRYSNAMSRDRPFGYSHIPAGEYVTELPLSDLLPQEPCRVYPPEETDAGTYLPPGHNPYDIRPVLAELSAASSAARSYREGRTWDPTDRRVCQWRSRRGSGADPTVSHWPLSRSKRPRKLSVWDRLKGKRQKDYNGTAISRSGYGLSEPYRPCSQYDLDAASRFGWNTPRATTTTRRTMPPLTDTTRLTDIQDRLVRSVVPLASNGQRLNFYDEASEWARERTSTPEGAKDAEALLSDRPGGVLELAGEADVFYDARNRVPLDGRQGDGYF